MIVLSTTSDVRTLKYGRWIVTFGRLPGADVRADEVRLGPDGTASFRLVAGDDRAQVRLYQPAGLVLGAVALLFVLPTSIRTFPPP